MIGELLKFLNSFDRIIVAFSGGVDSATLAAICKDRTDLLAVTVVSQVTPSREIVEAERVAKEIGVKHEKLLMDVLTPEFVKNTPERCYICKKMMLSELLNLADKKGYDAVFEGTNASELREDRPGYRAVKELDRVHSPWAKFGFTKDQIRDLAKKMGYSFSDNPPLACLATRIRDGEIDERKLKMVDTAENAIIRIAKVRQVRVRYYNSVAIIEVENNEIDKIAHKASEIKNELKNIGFKAVLLDLEGYRSGKTLF